MKQFLLNIGFTLALAFGCCILLQHADAASSTVIDATVNTTVTSHNGTTFTDVFTSDQTGYVFYRDSGGQCVYSKTTNGGTTWGAARIVDPQTDCVRIAVWYDRWTPDNTTGTLIHIVTLDSGSDEMWYTRLDTSGDTTSTVLNITGAAQGGTFSAGANLQAISRATDGALYAGVLDASDGFVLKCTTNCSTTSTGWTEAGTSTTWLLGNNWMLLNPLPNGNMLAVEFDVTNDDVLSKVWNNASSTWSAAFTTIDGACADNTTYDGHFGSAINLLTNEIYLAYGCDLNNFTSANDDIRTVTYVTSTWTARTDVETNSSLGITGVKLGLDSNTGNVYVVYSGRTTLNNAATTNVYYKLSTSTNMTSWGARQGPINQTTTDIYGLRIDGQNNERLYATWVDGTLSVLSGVTVADLTATTFSQVAYRFFTNQNNTDVGTPYAASNASSLIPLAGNPFRLRMLVQVVGGTDIAAQDLRLQYATSTAGGCDTSFSGETYVDVGTATSSVISYYDNPSPAHGAALTANGQDPIDGSNVIVNQTYVEQNDFTNDVAKILDGQDGKWDFSLINNSGSAGQTYCFRIIKSSGATLNSYTRVAEAQVDAAPTISGVTLNAGNSITLIEGTTTLIQATATVNDANGFADIFSISGKVFRTSSSTNCAANDNSCYIGTGATCSVNNCAGNSCIATCDYRIQYFAQPTDAGTPWAGDSWTALMQASDTVLSGVNSTSSGVQLLSLLAFRTTSTIGYGSFNQSQSMSSLTASSVIRSSGNVAMNMTVYGINMTSGAFSIPVGQQHFATSSLTYASGTTLLVNPGSTLAVHVPKPTTSTSALTPTSTLWWGISVPSGQMAATYTGYNSFIGVLHSLPWP